MIVPASTLATFAGIDRVFIVKDGKAAEKRVKLGRRIEDGVEILDGIAIGDRVVIQPGDLNDGDPLIAAGATE